MKKCFYYDDNDDDDCLQPFPVGHRRCWLFSLVLLETKDMIRIEEMSIVITRRRLITSCPVVYGTCRPCDELVGHEPIGGYHLMKVIVKKDTHTIE